MNTENRNDLGLKDTGAGCACCATASTPETADAATAAVTADVLVTGMTCSHCVSSVPEELSAMENYFLSVLTPVSERFVTQMCR